MEFETPTPDISFGKEIAQAFVVSAAVVAGAYAGLCLIGFAANKISARSDRRNMIKNQTQTN